MSAALTSVPSAYTTKVTHNIVSVDQAMARRWLTENNSHNRVISETRVAQYVSDMEAGRWIFNGETIQFDKNGVLLNGQHRLQAIVETGVAQTFLIVRGLDPNSQLTMDQGTRRSPADQLGIASIPVDTTTAAAIRILIRWERGLFFGRQSTAAKPTTSEMVNWAQEHPSSIELMRDLSEAGVRHVPCKPSVALAVALRLAQVDEPEALRFFSALRTGADLRSGSPILALRQRLLGDRDKDVKNTERDVIGMFIVAWNANRTGRSLAKIQKPKGGSWTRESFPTPR